VQRLKERKSDVIVGGNIGKNKATPNENAVDDYLFCHEALHPYVDDFVVNVSSPNTPNLRDLQEKEPLKQLLQAVKSANDKKSKPKPILLKIAPDLTDDELAEIAEVAQSHALAGIIATNTTLSRDGLASRHRGEMGGLSGAPLFERSTRVLARLSRLTGGTMPLIGVGGVASADQAWEKLRAGATAVQLYTGLVYGGLTLAARIAQDLDDRAKAQGLTNLSDLRGTGVGDWV
jgi:dihydroorotate dehydrogenase